MRKNAENSPGGAVKVSCLLTRWRNANVSANDPSSGLPQMRRFPPKQWFVGALVVLLGCSQEDCVAPRWQGIRYDVVEMGGQCWFAENLNVEAYRNGEAMTYGKDNDIWRRAPGHLPNDHDVEDVKLMANSTMVTLSSMRADFGPADGMCRRTAIGRIW